MDQIRYNFIRTTDVMIQMNSVISISKMAEGYFYVLYQRGKNAADARVKSDTHAASFKILDKMWNELG